MNAALDRQAFTLESIRLDARRLRLAAPLSTAAGNFEYREIALLQVTIRHRGRRQRGFGEASPLPGWTRETVPGIRSAVARIECPLALNGINELDHRIPDLDDSPVLRFGIESALLDALSRLAGLSLGRALANLRNTRPAGSVAVQFTIGAEPAERCIPALQAAQAAGYTHAKLKVGVSDPESDLARVRTILAACPDLTLRLDANGAWSIEQARCMLAALPADRVEMIEQPVADDRLTRLLARHDGRGPLVAGDESCADLERIRTLIRSRTLGAIVVKPSVVGGLLPAGRLFETARRNGIAVVISNLMESAVGRRAIAHLATAWPELEGPHGLATGQWFSEDVAPQPDFIEAARLHPGTAPGIGFEPAWPINA